MLGKYSRRIPQLAIVNWNTTESHNWAETRGMFQNQVCVDSKL